jgi:hypothetical protein
MLAKLIFQYYGYLLLFTLLTYLLGKSIRLFARLKTYFFADTFYSLLLGSAVLSTSYAVVLTAGKTVHIFFIFLGLAWYFYHKKQPAILISQAYSWQKNRLSYCAALGVVLSLLFAWETCFLFKTGDYAYLTQYKDISYYSLLADYLSISGCENRMKYYNEFDPATYKYPQLYHYFTLWNTAIASKMFGQGKVLAIWIEFFVLVYARLYI